MFFYKNFEHNFTSNIARKKCVCVCVYTLHTHKLLSNKDEQVW